MSQLNNQSSFHCYPELTVCPACPNAPNVLYPRSSLSAYATISTRFTISSLKRFARAGRASSIGRRRIGLYDSGANDNIISRATLKIILAHKIQVASQQKDIQVTYGDGSVSNCSVELHFSSSPFQSGTLAEVPETLWSAHHLSSVGYVVVTWPDNRLTIHDPTRDGSRDSFSGVNFGKQVYEIRGEDGLYPLYEDFLDIHRPLKTSELDSPISSRIAAGGKSQRGQRIPVSLQNAIKELHVKFSHARWQVMFEAVQTGLWKVDNPLITPTLIRRVMTRWTCRFCLAASMNKLPRQVGSGVHTDIPGAHIGCDFSEVAPTSPQGFNGRYSFKCYATGLLKNYPVVGKEQFLLVCKQFLMFCSTHNRKVHRFFSDDDSVILSEESRRYMAKCHIFQRNSSPYAHHRNSVERAAQTIIKKTSTLMGAQHILGAAFWPEAEKSMENAWNCSPNELSSRGSCPWEEFTGLTPKSDHIFALPFGSPVMVIFSYKNRRLQHTHIPVKLNTEKLPDLIRQQLEQHYVSQHYAARAELGVFMYANMESQGFMIYSPVRHWIYDRIEWRAVKGMTEEDIRRAYWGLMTVHVPLHATRQTLADDLVIPPRRPLGPLAAIGDPEHPVLRTDSGEMEEVDRIPEDTVPRETEVYSSGRDQPQRGVQSIQLVGEHGPATYDLRIGSVSEPIALRESFQERLPATAGGFSLGISNPEPVTGKRGRGRPRKLSPQISVSLPAKVRKPLRSKSKASAKVSAVPPGKSLKTSVTPIISDGTRKSSRQGKSSLDSSIWGKSATRTILSNFHHFAANAAARVLGITSTSDDNYHQLQSVFGGAVKRKRKDPDQPTEGDILKMEVDGDQRKEWEESIRTEINTVEVRSKCFKEIDPNQLPPGVVPLTSHFVFKQKRSVDGSPTRKKARLVADGNRQPWGPNDGTLYAPTGRPESSMLMFALAAWFCLRLESCDITGAFLYPFLKQPIFMWLPKIMGLRPDGRRRLVKLFKAIYGLKNAPQLFYEHLTKTILKWNTYKQCIHDPCMFVRWSKDKRRFLFLLIHVDDCKILSNSEKYKRQIRQQLEEEYEMTWQSPLTEYCGVKATYESDGAIALSQCGLIEKTISALDIKKLADTPYIAPSPRPSESLVDVVLFMSVVGMLLYLCQRTRPDIAYATAKLTRVTQKPQPADMRALRRVGEYLSATKEMSLVFRPATSRDIDPLDLYTIFDTVELFAYADAAYMSSTDSKSHSGMIICLGKLRAALQAISQQQQRITTSSTESEHEVIFQLVKLLIWWRAYMEELGFKQRKPTIIFEDNQSTISLCENPVKYSKQSKHYMLRIHFVHEHVATEETIELEYLSTTEQIADLLTKALEKKPFTYLRDKILGHFRGLSR